jgi:spore germination cell wall hydrolase CwlJ-like protein
MPKPRYKFSQSDIQAIKQAVYGEGASTDDATMKMIAQSIINRANSGRSKEFGATVPDMLKKGYYAVSNPNEPYKQATTGNFPDTQSKAAWGRASKLVDIAMSEPDSGKHQFYFTDDEINRQKKKKSFDFSKVKSTGRVGNYETYGY